MHIPDGFLDVKTAVATAACSATGLGVALRQLKTGLSSRRVPLMGLAAAFVFAAQMLNFPVAGGTSGHLLGAVLIAVLLGPGAAIVVMSAVLIVQCFLFADGGVLSLGANIFNMGVIAPLCGYGIYRGVYALLKGKRGQLVSIGFAAWCSTVLAAVFCTGELAWSGTVSWKVGFPAMVNVHILIGVGEALITTLVVAAIGRTRPDLLEENGAGRDSKGYIAPVVYGLLIAIGLIIFVSPFASPWPDGLEKVAATFGFDRKAVTSPVSPAPLADYQVPGIGSISVATVLAGGVGMAVVFLLSFLLARLLVPKSEPE